MIVGLILMVFAMLLVVGGGCVEAGQTVWGFGCIAFGAMGLGAGTAAVQLTGFTHFVDTSGQGMTVVDLLKGVERLHLDASVSVATPLFVQTTSTPVRAGGVYTVRYNGEPVLVVEAAPQETV